ncbi:Ank1 [Symbiodinium microadriaticum]|nr:Ank1 [Symbiodinium microadriaticum]
MKSQVVAATAAEASEKEHSALNDRAFKRRRIRKVAISTFMEASEHQRRQLMTAVDFGRAIQARGAVL